jgi:hypothetical protein
VRDLLLVVPSRGRPGNIARLRDAMRETCQGDTHLRVGIDTDDPAFDSYPGGVTYVVRDNLRKVTAWCNELAVPYTDDYRYIGHFGDDNVPRTVGWDTQVMAALEKTPFAFANDQYPSRVPGTLSCHIFMRSEVIKALGYFGPPSISHMYVDVAWYAWGTACGITYLHDVLIPHLHYTTGAGAHDQTYAVSFAGTSDDLDAWHAYCRDGSLNADIRKLGGREFTPEELAKFNRDLNIPDRWPG